MVQSTRMLWSELLSSSSLLLRECCQESSIRTPQASGTCLVSLAVLGWIALFILSLPLTFWQGLNPAANPRECFKDTFTRDIRHFQAA